MDSKDNNSNFPKSMNSYNQNYSEINKNIDDIKNMNNPAIPQNTNFSTAQRNSGLHNLSDLNSREVEHVPQSRTIGNSDNTNFVNTGDEKINNINSNKQDNANYNQNGSNLINKPKSNSSVGISVNKQGNPNNRINRSSNRKVGNRLLNKSPKARVLNRLMQKRQELNSKNAGSSFLKKAFLPSFMTGGLLNAKDKIEEQNSGEGIASTKLPKKVIITITMILIPALVSVVFCVLLIAAIQTYLSAVTLGHADSISEEDANKKIDKIFNVEEKLNNEISYVTSYISDIFVDENVLMNDDYEFATKKENEIDSDDLENNNSSVLDELKDFYPEISNYNNENYDQNDVYRFFIKLYNVYHYYLGKGVRLDMPLLMSVLNLQSSDTAEVFKRNTVDYGKSAIDQGTNNPDFDMNKDWSNYISTSNNSAHDIEVLAQGMVKDGKSASSTDGNYVDGIEFMTGGIGDIYYFNQLDYADKPYSYYGTIASHGCGPTSLSIVVSSLLKEVHDPVELTDYVCSIGGCFNEGSSWDSITQTPPHYGLKVNMTTNTQEVITALGSGNSLAIAIMCPGHFTSGGHFIVLTASNSNGQVTVADPASRDRSTDWDFNIVAEENCGAYWIVSK